MNPTTPLRVIIVEDLILLRQDLEKFIQQQPGFMVTGACGTVHAAIELINNTKPDLLLLDIELPDGTGFDILEQISVPTKVIFQTAYNEYAIDAIKYAAIDYLLKPVDKNELKAALQKVINTQPLLREQIDIFLDSFRKKKPLRRLALRGKDFVQVVEIQEINYFLADNSYTTVFLNSGKKVVTTRSIKDYEELLSGNSFLRTHQSYLINDFNIDRYQPKEGIIYLKDGTEIPVSSRKKEIIDQYFKTL